MKMKFKALMFFAVVFLLGMGFLNIPQSANGVVIKKERLYNAEAGLFTIELEDKFFPKKVYYDRMEYNAFEVREKLIVDYKISLIRKPYVVSHILIEDLNGYFYKNERFRSY